MFALTEWLMFGVSYFHFIIDCFTMLTSFYLQKVLSDIHCCELTIVDYKILACYIIVQNQCTVVYTYCWCVSEYQLLMFCFAFVWLILRDIVLNSLNVLAYISFWVFWQILLMGLILYGYYYVLISFTWAHLIGHSM
jgi:hypothetical protein